MPATQDDVRRIALALPSTFEHPERFAFGVRAASAKGKPKDFVWVWLDRPDPKKGRVPNPAVIAVRVPDLEEKEALLAAEPDVCFTEPHYNGYPAVMVRLQKVGTRLLRELIEDAWRAAAPKSLRRDLYAT